MTPNAPEWHGKLWSANADRVGIERTQDNEFIHASDPAFNDYYCTDSQGLKELFTILQSCKAWEKPKR